MAFPSSNRIDFSSATPKYQNILTQFQGDWVDQINVEQMFILIDGVLPFEACLYYQVLPLFLDGSRLNLGVVTPEDTAASDYVRRIISYLNYTLVTHPISSEALQTVLSAYLNHVGKQQSQTNQASIQPQPSSSERRFNQNSARARAGQQVDCNAHATYVVDSPDTLEPEDIQRLKSTAAELVTPPPKIPFTPPAPAPTQDEAVVEDPFASPAAWLGAADETELQEAETQLLEAFTETAPSEDQRVSQALPESLLPESLPIASTADPSTPDEAEAIAPQPPPNVPPAATVLPALEIQVNYLNSPIEVLAMLPPKTLVQELLGRILVGGIGRLYFERQPQNGRILWSQNGVLQSVLDKLSPETFQGVINELKRMNRLPLLPIQTTKQVEIERMYQQARLLLRFRFMPTPSGEEATLQVLRGAALKFYQQQQLANLGRDAVSIAKQLQHKVNEIRDRSRSDPNLSNAKLESLTDLNRLIHYIETQIGSLQRQESDPESESTDAESTDES